MFGWLEFCTLPKTFNMEPAKAAETIHFMKASVVYLAYFLDAKLALKECIETVLATSCVDV